MSVANRGYGAGGNVCTTVTRGTSLDQLLATINAGRSTSSVVYKPNEVTIFQDDQGCSIEINPTTQQVENVVPRQPAIYE